MIRELVNSVLRNPDFSYVIELYKSDNPLIVKEDTDSETGIRYRNSNENTIFIDSLFFDDTRIIPFCKDYAISLFGLNNQKILLDNHIFISSYEDNLNVSKLEELEFLLCQKHNYQFKKLYRMDKYHMEVIEYGYQFT